MPASDPHFSHFSAAEIELLQLLSRSPETFWSPSAAANVIGVDEREIAMSFVRFEREGLLERGRQSDAYRFAPERDEDREAIARLTEE